MSRTLKTESRPFGWRLLLLGFGLVALRGWGRIWTLLNQYSDYQALDQAPPVELYLAFNACGGLVASLVLFGLLRRTRWLPSVVVPITVVVAVGDLAWLANVSGTTYDRQNIPFLSVVWLGLVICTGLISQRRAFQHYFQRYAKES